MAWLRRKPTVLVSVKSRADLLQELDAELCKENDLLFHELRCLPDDSRRRFRLQSDAVRVAKGRAFIAPFITKSRATLETEPEIAEILHRLAQHTLRVLHQRQPSHPQERATLARILLALEKTQCHFPLSEIRSSDHGESVLTSRPQIVVPAELLYQAHALLFPAERMLVAAGRRDGNAIRLSALFDVTGEASTAHVLSDPAALAKALILMSKTGSHLAAWIHSHPGRGPGCTHPSSIDLQQQEDWLRCYSKDLLGVIAVQDGCFRLWGTAFDEGRIEVHVAGNGLQKEESDDRIYRFCDE